MSKNIRLVLSPRQGFLFLAASLLIFSAFATIFAPKARAENNQLPEENNQLPVEGKPLLLTSMCQKSGDKIEVVRVRNETDQDQDYSYKVLSTGEEGNGTVAAGEDEFIELKVNDPNNPNTTKLFDADGEQDAVKALNNSECRQIGTDNPGTEVKEEANLTSICNTFDGKHIWRLRYNDVEGAQINTTLGKGPSGVEVKQGDSRFAGDKATTKVVFESNDPTLKDRVVTKAANNEACKGSVNLKVRVFGAGPTEGYKVKLTNNLNFSKNYRISTSGRQITLPAGLRVRDYEGYYAKMARYDVKKVRAFKANEVIISKRIKTGWFRLGHDQERNRTVRAYF